MALKYDLYDITRVDSWLENIFAESMLGEFDLALVANVCWFVWKDRCRRAFENCALDPLETAYKASYSVSEFWNSNDWVGPTEAIDIGRSATAWLPPPKGVFKVNCDGGFVEESKKVGLGVVFRDSAGSLIESACVATVASSVFYGRGFSLEEGYANGT